MSELQQRIDAIKTARIIIKSIRGNAINNKTKLTIKEKKEIEFFEQRQIRDIIRQEVLLRNP